MSVAEQGRSARGQVAPVDAGGRRALEQRVVDVGDVLDVPHPVARVAPGAVQQVEGDVRGRVPQVRGVVRRDAADVQRRERSPGAVGRVPPVAVSCRRTGRPRPGTAGTSGAGQEITGRA